MTQSDLTQATEQASLFDDALNPWPAQIVVDEAVDELNVVDAAENQTPPSTRFTITSYGADLSVFDLIRRIGKEILIPPAFQRKYVWNQKQASRFIESLLMGLPVPGVFIFIAEDKQQLIVDGQQRLLTLSRFTSGIWEVRERKQGERVIRSTIPFKLIDVAEPWCDKTWDEIGSESQESIYSSLIHATIFRQDHPKKHDRSIYEVFERINTGGSRLSPQEIRACVSHGSFVEFLNQINQNEAWRQCYGNPSPRIKDEELILRFFALMERPAQYSRPMSEFLDNYLASNRDISSEDKQRRSDLFVRTITALTEAVGKKLFRPENALNAAVFDAVMVGCATIMETGKTPPADKLAGAYRRLLADDEFNAAYRKATADDENVKTRLRKAKAYFSET